MPVILDKVDDKAPIIQGLNKKGKSLNNLTTDSVVLNWVRDSCWTYKDKEPCPVML